MSQIHSRGYVSPSDRRKTLADARNNAQEARRRALARQRRRSNTQVALAGSAIALGGCLALLFIVFIGPLFGGWILMLVLGALHHDVSSSVPALGYWISVLLALAVSIVGGLVRR